MKVTRLFFVVMIIAMNDVLCSKSPAFELLDLPVHMSTGLSAETAESDEILTEDDYDRLLTFEQFRVGISRDEAIKNMVSCTYNATKLAIEIY